MISQNITRKWCTKVVILIILFQFWMKNRLNCQSSFFCRFRRRRWWIRWWILQLERNRWTRIKSNNRINNNSKSLITPDILMGLVIIFKGVLVVAAPPAVLDKWIQNRKLICRFQIRSCLWWYWARKWWNPLGKIIMVVIIRGECQIRSAPEGAKFLNRSRLFRMCWGGLIRLIFHRMNNERENY